METHKLKGFFMKKLFMPLCLMFWVMIMQTSCTSNSSSSEDDFDASVVCPAEGLNAYGMPNRGTFIDVRDNQEYKYVTIGEQVWMAENLKFDAPYSECPDEYYTWTNYCEKVGRLYQLTKRVNSMDVLNQDLADTICPAGWHVSSKLDWEILGYNMGGYGQLVGPRLTTSSVIEGSTKQYKVGTDDCGFNSMPARAGHPAYYLTSSHYSLNGLIYECFLSGTEFGCYQTSNQMSIRCVKD
jgi:uncharacterized protein (TIGR02145 family)